MKELNEFLTIKHQIRLLSEVVEDWILPSPYIVNEDALRIKEISTLLEQVKISLETQFTELMRASHGN